MGGRGWGRIMLLKYVTVVGLWSTFAAGRELGAGISGLARSLSIGTELKIQCQIIHSYCNDCIEVLCL